MICRHGFLRSRLPLSLLLFAAACLAVGCRGGGERDDASVGMDLAISPTPPAAGPARLLITLTDSAGALLNGAQVWVEGNMSHAGMVPVRDTALSEGDPGRYVVPEFTFPMAGDWVLTVEAILPDGRRILQDFATNVVSPLMEKR